MIKNHFKNYVDGDSKKNSLKEKKNLVEDFMVKYKRAKMRLECFDGITVYCSNTLKEKEQLLSMVNYIDKVIQFLSAQSQEYFINEYLTHPYNCDWWVSKYNKTTFAKIRNYALNEFLIYVK